MKLIVIVIFVLPLSVLAQSTRGSLGLDVAFPGNQFSASTGTGIGLSGRLEHRIYQRLSVFGNVGYISFAEKTIQGTPSVPYQISNKVSMIPIQIGVKYYLFSQNGAQSGLFLSGDLGLTLSYTSAKVNNASVDIPNSSDFSYAPGIGYMLKIFELSYRQQFISGSGKSIDFSNFRIAYIFPNKISK